MTSEEQQENRCCLCLESQENKVRITLICGHTMDYNCFLNLRRPQCPLCRKEIDTPTQFIPPEFVFLPQEENIPPPPPPSSFLNPLLQRQHAHDIVIDLEDLLEPQSRPPFPSQWFRQFDHSPSPLSNSRRRRHQDRRRRQRETRRRYHSSSFRPSNEDFID
jgi:hypothetical protein